MKTCRHLCCVLIAVIWGCVSGRQEVVELSFVNPAVNQPDFKGQSLTFLKRAAGSLNDGDVDYWVWLGEYVSSAEGRCARVSSYVVLVLRKAVDGGGELTASGVQGFLLTGASSLCKFAGADTAKLQRARGLAHYIEGGGPLEVQDIRFWRARSSRGWDDPVRVWGDDHFTAGWLYLRVCVLGNAEDVASLAGLDAGLVAGRGVDVRSGLGAAILAAYGLEVRRGRLQLVMTTDGDKARGPANSANSGNTIHDAEKEQ